MNTPTPLEDLEVVFSQVRCKRCGTVFNIRAGTPYNQITHRCLNPRPEHEILFPDDPRCAYLGERTDTDFHLVGCGGGTYALFHCTRHLTTTLPLLQGTRRQAAARQAGHRLCLDCPDFRRRAVNE